MTLNSQSSLKKETWCVMLLDFKVYYKPTVIKRVWYWHKNKNILLDQRRRIVLLKETINKTKRETMEMKNIFANHMFKGLISYIYKELIPMYMCMCVCVCVCIRNVINQFKNGQRSWITFYKEEIQMAKGYMKRHSMSQNIREIHIKATMKYHLTPIRMAIMKMLRDNKYLWGGR